MEPRNEKTRSRVVAIAAGPLLFALAACTHSGSPVSNAGSAENPQTIVSALAEQRPDLPKVPFGNRPCQSLSQDEQKQIEMQAQGYAAPVPGAPNRAPGNLPFDNVCMYHDFSVGYMAQGDYKVNRDSNRSTKHSIPQDLPDAFYGKQDGLWFKKNGYYVNIEGRSRLLEPVARVVAAKL